MFKGRIISRSNINGKVHTFQKDFDDYDQYQEFIGKNPDYNVIDTFQNFWNPWGRLERFASPVLDDQYMVNTKYLPEGIDLTKYETRRHEKRQKALEQADRRRTLESSKAYLENYLKENEDDNDAKADLEKVESELKLLA